MASETNILALYFPKRFRGPSPEPPTAAPSADTPDYQMAGPPLLYSLSTTNLALLNNIEIFMGASHLIGIKETNHYGSPNRVT
jgi:hypothetical protein